METEQGKKNWLYGVIALLLLALVIETGFLISKSFEKQEGRKSQVTRVENYPSPARYSARPFPRFFRDEGWDPFEEMRQMQEEMNRIFDESFGRIPRMSGLWGPAAGVFHSTPAAGFSPAVDIQETDDDYIAKVDLPGMEKDKIQVRATGNILTVQGERRVEINKEDARKGFYAAERSYGSFARSVSLPGPVDEAGIKAEYQNGVLTVTLPKLKGSSSSGKTVQIV